MNQVLVDEPPPLEGTEESVEGDELPAGEIEEDEEIPEDEYWEEGWPAL